MIGALFGGATKLLGLGGGDAAAANPLAAITKPLTDLAGGGVMGLAQKTLGGLFGR